MASSTLVTGTVRDPSGNVYANGVYEIAFVNLTGINALPLSSGSPFQQIINGSLDSFGSFSQLVTDSASITPAGTQWSFNIIDSTRKVGFSYLAPTAPNAGAITGTTIDISAALQAVSAYLTFPQPTTGSQSFRFSQATPATSWVINHNFNVPTVEVAVYDLTSNLIIPDSVVLTNSSTCTVNFLQAQAGQALVLNVGNWSPSVASPNNIIGNPNSSQSINTQPFFFNGPVSFQGLVNCKNIEASIFCVDTANTQGWAGGDPGAWINSAIAAFPSTGGQLIIASGQYSITTPITGAQDATIVCPSTGAMAAGAAALNFIPATGTLLTWSNSALSLIGCTLKTTTSTTSVGVKLIQANYTTNIERNHIVGFFGGLLVTGDGVSTYSTGVHITNNLIDAINARCGAGAGYGVSFDHARDVTYDKNQIYSVTDCATGIPMIIDTGVGGMWMSGSTFEQGLHAGVIRNTNQGGAYGGAPAAIWGEGITWDLSPGGDALLFDSSLGAADIRFFCTACWAAGAGMNTAGTAITPGAIGFNVQGGSNIHFVGGISRVNASWGALAGTAGTNISFEGVNVHANNQGNTAGVGGIKVAGPTGWRVVNNRSGNVIEAGGHQVWGVDLSGASTNGIVSGNDLRNNTSGRINYPAGIATAGVDAPEFGSGTGLHFYGPTMWLEQPAPSGIGGEAVCYGDSTAHVLKCSYNNGSFFAQTQTIANGTAVMTTAAITAGNCGATVTVAATGVAASDRIAWAFNAAPAGSNAGLVAWPTANNVNFAYCPNSAETPAAATINWQVTR